METGDSQTALYQRRFFLGVVTEYGGNFIIELLASAPIENLPVHDDISIAGGVVKLRSGKLMLHADSVSFAADGVEESAFEILKEHIARITTGEGTIIWEQDVEALVA